MPRKKAQSETSMDAHDYLNTAPCVPAIRQAVAAWRSENYPGVTATTRELLNFWFATDHRLANGTPFRYHAAQREAIETLIYVYEAANVRSRKALLEQFAMQTKNLRMPSYDDFARYCVKMATGSGKTLVMALAVVWQFANACREHDAEYAKTFLILAPNVIVFDRLRSDFANGAIFRRLPLIPKHFHWWWEMEYYMRGDPERPHTQGALYLTNIQQFYDRLDGEDAAPNPVEVMLGSSPPTAKTEISDFDERIAARDGLIMVLNDEAHHTHDEESEWNKCIRGLHDRLQNHPPIPLAGNHPPTPLLTKEGGEGGGFLAGGEGGGLNSPPPDLGGGGGFAA